MNFVLTYKSGQIVTIMHHLLNKTLKIFFGTDACFFFKSIVKGAAGSKAGVVCQHFYRILPQHFGV